MSCTSTRVIDLADADRRLARDFEARRPRAEAEPRLAPGKKLAEVDVLVELEADDVVARPDDRCRDFLARTARCSTCSPTVGDVGDDRHDPAGGHVLDPDQLLLPATGRQLADREASPRSALPRAARPAAAPRSTAKRWSTRTPPRLRLSLATADFLRISDSNMLLSASSGAQFAPNWDFMDNVVKRAFLVR